MMAPDTLQCPASMLEADGLEHILKKILHPNNKLEYLPKWTNSSPDVNVKKSIFKILTQQHIDDMAVIWNDF